MRDVETSGNDSALSTSPHPPSGHPLPACGEKAGERGLARIPTMARNGMRGARRIQWSFTRGSSRSRSRRPSVSNATRTKPWIDT